MPPAARRGASWRMRAKSLAARFGAPPQNLVFTSGGTEADALAIHALGAGRRLIVGATEHDAVRSAAPARRALLPVDRDGVADLDALAAWLADGPAALVCLMLANNETGTIQPIAEAAGAVPPLRRIAACRCRAGGRSDGGQPRRPSARTAWPSRRTSWAARRAPARCCWRRRSSAIAPLIAGGGQERGRRGGTPPLPAIAGFAAAAAAARDASHLAPLRDAVEAAAIAHGRDRLRRRRAAAGQHHLPRAARRAGRCPGDRARPRRHRGQRRRRLQLRQGGREPCAGRDGPGRARRPGDPRLAAVERDRRATSTPSPPPIRRMADRLRDALAPRAA